MNGARYNLVAAAADLAGSGLKTGCLLRSSGRWVELDPAALPPEWGFCGAVIDSRAVTGGELFVGLRGEHTDGRLHVGAALRSGAPAALTRFRDGRGKDPLLAEDAPDGAVVLLSESPRLALGALAAGWRGRMPAAVVGVTGSNGKTTTKDMLAALLSGAGPVHATAGNLNNDLGVPLTLLGLRPAHRHAVIEMGASAPGEIAALARLSRPAVGVITNAAPAHLAGFGSLDTVIETKGEMLDALDRGGTAVLNADSPGFARWSKRARCPVVSWGREAGDHRWRWEPLQDIARGRLVLDGDEFVVPAPGPHNAANLACAVLAARACGVDDRTLRRGLESYRGSDHRAVLLNAGGVLLLDDCYNANPVSMVQAARMLRGLPGTGIAIGVLGAMGELGPGSDDLHRACGADLREAGLDLALVLPGAEALAEGFERAGGEAVVCADHAAAAAELAARAVPGDRVLFKGSRSAAVEAVLEIYLADGGGRETERGGRG